MLQIRHIWLISSIIVLAMTHAASAGNVVYVHGRSSMTWPEGGRLVVPSSWSQVTLSYDGSTRLGDAGVRAQVRDQIRAACTTTDCVVVCHSAGCARTLLAYSDLAAQGVSVRVLFTEALASAAGGSEVAELVTRGGIRLIAKLFDQLAAIDDDLPPSNMRFSTWSFIQNAAPSPVYHLAGNRNICLKVNALGAIAAGVWIGGHVAGPVGTVIGGLGGLLFGTGKLKLCGNHWMPGELGDGAVPVHSAAGYADRGIHSSHADGAAKYVFRAYEQVPLFASDHMGIFKSGVELGSLRLAVRSVTANQCVNALNASDDGEALASIVYDDADSSKPVMREAAPILMLQICGDDMFSTASGPRLYATCNGQSGCCDRFSTGTTSGCTCGETLCVQSGLARRSYFTGDNCSGTEYALDQATWDGTGMIGAAKSSVQAVSVRDASGRCQALTIARAYNGDGCVDYLRTSATYTAQRVYRPFITQYASDPSGEDDEPGFVVKRVFKNAPCP